MKDSKVEEYARGRLRNDIRVCRLRGQKYFPVIWPGFSWGNLKQFSTDEFKYNSTPRRGGAFLWHQFYSFYNEAPNGFYGAMFDEVDEGTAFFKVIASRNDPVAIDNTNGPADNRL